MFILEVADWEVSPFRSCHLGKCHWEIVTWESSLGKRPLGKCLTQSINIAKNVIKKMKHKKIFGKKKNDMRGCKCSNSKELSL